MDWQMILLKLRKHYKSLHKIAMEIGVSPNSLQKIARYGVKSDIAYSTGKALVDLHDKYVKGKA